MQTVTDATFENIIKQSKVPVVVDFWAEWCGPCKTLTPILDDIAGELGDQVTVLSMDVDQNHSTPARFSIMGVPTVITFVNGEPVHRFSGGRSKDQVLEDLAGVLG